MRLRRKKEEERAILVGQLAIYSVLAVIFAVWAIVQQIWIVVPVVVVIIGLGSYRWVQYMRERRP